MPFSKKYSNKVRCLDNQIQLVEMIILILWWKF